MNNQLSIRTNLHAGYRPVHSMVFPDQFGYWVPGWFDLDSLNICGSISNAGGVTGFSAGENAAPAATGAPPPPPAP
jgi:hypothetical protein